MARKYSPFGGPQRILAGLRCVLDQDVSPITILVFRINVVVSYGILSADCIP